MTWFSTIEGDEHGNDMDAHYCGVGGSRDSDNPPGATAPHGTPLRGGGGAMVAERAGMASEVAPAGSG